jgi:cold shock CspA family protein
MLYLAAVPFAYDIAIAVLGDQDFKPVLQHVRRFGKRVAIASIKESCSPEFSDPRDEARVKDFDIIWLGDLLEALELCYEPHRRQCESPSHKGNRPVWTTFHPRKGQRFYCDVCRAEFNRQRLDTQTNGDEAALGVTEARSPENNGVGTRESGVVKKKFSDTRKYGFIHAADGDYFFHIKDVDLSLGFVDIEEGMDVDYEVARRPSPGRSGHAQNVRRRALEG